MKKRTLAILLLLILLFSSCEKRHLNRSNYGDDFQKRNAVLYRNEQCEHFLVYTKPDDLASGVDKNICHAVYCKWGSCEQRLTYEPHTLNVSHISSTRAQYKENGYLYHEIGLICVDCRETAHFFLLCEQQTLSCMGIKICRKEISWEEILCDTPYEISYG